jgi:uncharacterized membrane protein
MFGGNKVSLLAVCDVRSYWHFCHKTQKLIMILVHCWFWRFLIVVYNTQDFWTLSIVHYSKGYSVLGTGSVSIFK